MGFLSYLPFPAPQPAERVSVRAAAARLAEGPPPTPTSFRMAAAPVQSVPPQYGRTAVDEVREVLGAAAEPAWTRVASTAFTQLNGGLAPSTLRLFQYNALSGGKATVKSVMEPRPSTAAKPATKPAYARAAPKATVVAQPAGSAAMKTIEVCGGTAPKVLVVHPKWMLRSDEEFGVCATMGKGVGVPKPAPDPCTRTLVRVHAGFKHPTYLYPQKPPPPPLLQQQPPPGHRRRPDESAHRTGHRRAPVRQSTDTQPCLGPRLAPPSSASSPISPPPAFGAPTDRPVVVRGAPVFDPEERALRDHY